MPHTIFVNQQGVIEIHFLGALSFADDLALGKKVLSLTTTIKDEGKQAKILVDFTQFAGRHPLTLRLNVAIIKDLEFTKIAIYGADEEAQIDIGKITTETDTADRIRLFSTRQQAESWLTADP